MPCACLLSQQSETGCDRWLARTAPQHLTSLSHVPGRKSSFSPGRIILDPIHRLPSEPCGPGDLANASGLAKHRLRTFELLAAHSPSRECRLTEPVDG